MSYPGLKLTAQGHNILAKGLTGKEIKFSKVALGSGNFDYDTETVADLTALRVWEMDLPIVNKYIDGNGYVLIEALVNNFDLARGFPAKESGVYAIDPDSGDELLYAYGNVGDEYTYIPSNTGAVHKNLFFSYRIEIQDAPNVTFNINFDFAYVSQSEFDNHLEAAHPHKNIPNHFDDIDFTRHFWATDQDNHLHKISSVETKKLLLSDLENVVAFQFNKQDYLNLFYKNVTELGLEPNLFVIENFKPPDTIDLTKIKVTSSAKGGYLLGISDFENVAIGQHFLLVDGVNQQTVTVNEIVQGQPAYLSVAQPLLFDFDLNNTYLVRSEFAANTSASVTWSDNENFAGYPAHSQRTLELDTSAENKNAFEISQDGIFDSSGFFTLNI